MTLCLYMITPIYPLNADYPIRDVGSVQLESPILSNRLTINWNLCGMFSFIPYIWNHQLAFASSQFITIFHARALLSKQPLRICLLHRELEFAGFAIEVFHQPQLSNFIGISMKTIRFKPPKTEIQSKGFWLNSFSQVGGSSNVEKLCQNHLLRIRNSWNFIIPDFIKRTNQISLKCTIGLECLII